MALASTLDTAPDFGPASPPPESIAAGQVERVVKDILHVGKHKIGYDAAGKEVYWTVTPQTLAQILKDFQQAKRLNIPCNLGKTHGDDDLLIHPDDLIAPIADLKIASDVLWMSAYVTPEQAEYLKNPARLVSPAIIPNYTRAGHRFAEYLTHVAVTDRPVQANQLPFLAMADTAGGGSMNPELVDAINMLMEAAGLSKLADVVDEADLISQLKGVSAALGKTVTPAETEPPVPAEGGDMAAELNLPGMAPALADTIRKMFDQQGKMIKQLSDDLSARKLADAAAAKNAFSVRIGELLGAGVPKTTLDGKKALADKLGSYDLALLDGLAPTLNTGVNSKARKMADPNPPNLTGSDPESDRKAIAERVAKSRNISLEEAMKYVPA